MPCREPREMVGAFFDGELVGEEREAMAEHLRGCAVCASALSGLQRLSERLSTVERSGAPPGLSARIRSDIAAEAARHGLPIRLAERTRRWGWPAKAAAFAAACLVTAVLTWGVVSRIGTTNHLELDVLSAHLRSLVQDKTVQIASSESHVVKPWFVGRVDFAPSVTDLASAGFPLIGGRIDYVGERRVGALVYKRRDHVVSIFMWAASEGVAAPNTVAASGNRVSSFKRSGHNMMTWTKDGVVYWAVTDLNQAELEQLQRLL